MKSVKEIANLLDETLWGECFSRTEIEIIAKYMSIQYFETNEDIFRQGERDKYMAFIVEGKVDIIKESADSLEKIVVTLSARTHFGEMSFIDDEPRSATAIAKEDTTLLVLGRDNFEAMIEAHPKIGIEMLRKIAKIISQRLRMTTGKLVYTRT